MSGAINSTESGAEYGWYIYESFIEEGCWDHKSDARTGRAVAVVGPSGCSDENERKLKNGEGDEFELYDDDDVLYYKGRIIGDYSGFEPMEDYGMPNAGAVHVKMDGEYI